MKHDEQELPEVYKTALKGVVKDLERIAVIAFMLMEQIEAGNIKSSKLCSDSAHAMYSRAKLMRSELSKIADGLNIKNS